MLIAIWQRPFPQIFSLIRNISCELFPEKTDIRNLVIISRFEDFWKFKHHIFSNHYL